MKNVQITQGFIAAAEHVLENHLSKPYQDSVAEGGRQGGYRQEWIQRPLHGLVHAVRKSLYAAVFVDRHRELGQVVSENELQKMMVALLFQVSGRESEMNQIRGVSVRGRYRKASADNFEAFVRNNKEMKKLFSEEDINNYSLMIQDRYPRMGDKTLEYSIFRHVHAIDLLRCRESDDLFYEPKKEHRGFTGLGKGVADKFNSNDVAVDIINYQCDLFEATGDDVPNIDIGPGHSFQKWVERRSDKKEVLDTYVYDKDTPVIRRNGKPQNTPLFEQCQTSVEGCLRNALSVPPPFGIQFQFPSDLKVAVKKPVKRVENEKNKSDREKVQENKKALESLQNQKKELEEKIMILKAVLGDEINMEANEKKHYQGQLIQLESDLEQIVVKIKEIESGVSVAGKRKVIYSAKPYTVKVQDEACYDGILRDEIKIPGDHNCCFNAALVGAKHAGIDLPVNIQNHYQLRQAVVSKMRDMHDKGELTLEDVSSAITGYNLEFGTSLSTFDEYLTEIGMLDNWGGEFELRVMGEILGANINIHQMDHNIPPHFIDLKKPHTIHVHHTGNHYNLYVDSGAWVDLPADDPVHVFDKQVHQERLRILKEALPVKNVASVKGCKNDYGQTKEGIPITYDNYFKYSDELKNYEMLIKLHQNAIRESKDKREEKIEAKKLETTLMQAVNHRAILIQMRAGFQQERNINLIFQQRIHDLLLAYDREIYAVQMSEANIQDLLMEKINLQQKNPKDKRIVEINKTLEAANEIHKNVIEKAAAKSESLNKELQFIFREVDDFNGKSKMMLRFQNKNVKFQRLLTRKKRGESDFQNTVAMTHLKEFLAAQYDPNKTLKENIKQYFKHWMVKDMLMAGGPVGGIRNLDKKDARHIYKPKTGTSAEYYDEELIEHYSTELANMMIAEGFNADNVVLYNALDHIKAVGNDVIRDISSLLSGKGYESMMRLFSEDFPFENAEAFRKHIYQDLKIHDGDAEFHKRGIACGLSPFQALNQESPLDLWTHDSNIQSFDRFTYEIFPKLQAITKDKKLIQNLKKQYEELITLSEGFGARMSQFILSEEDAKNYTWVSGAYGYKMPTAAKEMGRVFQTDELGKALQYYKEDPAGFIDETKKTRAEYISDKITDAEFQHKSEGVNKKKVYDDQFKDDDKLTLGQLQARMYLHPELFQPGRMRVNTYMSRPQNPKLLREYEEKVAKFSSTICELLIRAKQEQKIEGENVPKELLESIVGFKPCKRVENKFLKQAEVILKKITGVDIDLFKEEIILPPLYTGLIDVLRKCGKKETEDEFGFEVVSDIGLAIHEYLSKSYKDDKGKKEGLLQLFYHAIASGDLETMDYLLQYAHSSLYNAKEYPINLDQITDGKTTASALILACQNNQQNILARLLEIREKSVGLFLTNQTHLAVRRTGTDPETKNTPLHYLALRGNSTGFMALAGSLSRKRSWRSYAYYMGDHLNRDGNNPLHILAFNESSDSDIQSGRRATLQNLLSSDNQHIFETLFGVELITQQNEHGVSPLMTAALTQNIEAVALLADKAGLSENVTNLYLWIAQSPFERLDYIQKHREDFGEIRGFIPEKWSMHDSFKGVKMSKAEKDFAPPKTINELKLDFYNALSISKDEAVKCFDELKVQAGQESSRQYASELIEELTRKGQDEALKVLGEIASDKRLGLKSSTDSGTTPLIEAAKKQDYKTIINLLSSKDALDVKRTQKDDQGNTALHYLMQQPDSLEAIEAIITKGSWTQMVSSASNPINIGDSQGMTPIHVALYTGNIPLVNAIDDKFKTRSSMLYKARSGLYNQFYASLYVEDSQGRTPIVLSTLLHPDKPDMIKKLGDGMDLTSTQIKAYQEIANHLLNKREIPPDIIKDTKGWPQHIEPTQAYNDLRRVVRPHMRKH